MAKVSKNKKIVKGKGFRKYILWFWRLFGLGVLAIVLVFLSASWGFLGKMPTFEALENPETNLASEIISSDLKTLGKFYFNDNRTPVGYNNLSEHLVNALVATEDVRYYKHSGIDVRGTSTITQQLARQLFVGEKATGYQRYFQKIKEWVIATRLERNYTKQEIMAMYFNIYDFGNNADGIRSAARIYFGKEPKELKVEESAMLVGMLKNSSLFNPRKEYRKDTVQHRRNVVLKQMQKYNFISKREKDSLQQLPLKMNFTPETHNLGIATYFREYLRDKFLRNWINENPKEDGSKYNISLDGLKIYTTLDYRMQTYAEEAVSEHMSRLQAEFFVQNTPKRNSTAPFVGVTPEEIEGIYSRAMRQSERWRVLKKKGRSNKEIRASFDKKREMTVFSWKGDIDTIMTPLDSIKYYKHFLRTGMMSMDPRTGHVKAWVGGTNYKHFKYDQVIQGARQAGSTFKPFVYATAIDQLHYTPCDLFPDTPYCIPAGKHGNVEAWCPKNSSDEYSPEMRTLKNALANSVNTITAQLMDKVGPQPVASLARKLGVTSEILEVPSIALGTPDITVYEMVGAYGAFANQGVYVKPVMVTRIEDKNGTILYEYIPETRDVLSKEAAYTTVNLMQGVTEAGSGGRLRHNFAANQTVYKEIITGYPYELTNPIAGKTGTTQNQSDGWFMGMVPNLVTGVWVGGDDRATHFKSITYGQGASMALPIWGLYMKKCYADADLGVSKDEFEKPENFDLEGDCSKVNRDTDINLDEDAEEELDF